MNNLGTQGAAEVTLWSSQQPNSPANPVSPLLLLYYWCLRVLGARGIPKPPTAVNMRRPKSSRALHCLSGSVRPLRYWTATSFRIDQDMGRVDALRSAERHPHGMTGNTCSFRISHGKMWGGVGGRKQGRSGAA